jgi:hypothetical protein
MCPFDIFNSAKLKNAIKLALLYVKIVVVDGSVSWSSGRLPPVFFSFSVLFFLWFQPCLFFQLFFVFWPAVDLEVWFGFWRSSSVLGLIRFLVHWFVLDLEVFDCFGAPVVIWCGTT